MWADDGHPRSRSRSTSRRGACSIARLPEQIAELLRAVRRAARVPAPGAHGELPDGGLGPVERRARRALATSGVWLSIDDFGTGYSSLSHLKRLPIDEIKIDRSFVMQMHVDANDFMIVRATVDLGRNLGLRVVAEGVEDRETFDRLADFGCDEAQGYYISRPMPLDEFTRWLSVRTPEAIVHEGAAARTDAAGHTARPPARRLSARPGRPARLPLRWPCRAAARPVSVCVRRPTGSDVAV